MSGLRPAAAGRAGSGQPKRVLQGVELGSRTAPVLALYARPSLCLTAGKLLRGALKINTSACWAVLLVKINTALLPALGAGAHTLFGGLYSSAGNVAGSPQPGHEVPTPRGCADPSPRAECRGAGSPTPTV